MNYDINLYQIKSFEGLALTYSGRCGENKWDVAQFIEKNLFENQRINSLNITERGLFFDFKGRREEYVEIGMIVRKDIKNGFIV